MSGLRFSLLVKVVLTLAATGLLPIVISGFQLRTNDEALLRQIQATHMGAARSTAARLESHLGTLRTLLETAAQTAYHQGGRSQAMRELLTGTLQSRPEVAALAVWNADGGEVIKAQRSDLSEAFELAYDESAPPQGFLGSDRRWLRLAESLPEGLGQVALVTSGEDFEDAVRAVSFGDEAQLYLADRDDGTVLYGDFADLSAFPRDALVTAFNANMLTSSQRYEGPDLPEAVVVAHAQLPGTSWVVMSIQPARLAEEAKQKIRRATIFAALAALAMTTALSAVAWTTVIRPLRRILHAQQDLLGGVPSSGGSEIAQLESAFQVLEQRIRDQEEIGRVFLGRYQVLDVLGSGAMGTVFKGFDPKLERTLALKTIRLEVEDFKREKLVATLLREAVTSARFNHPNIVTVYDAADEGAAAFIAMELVDGITLENLIAVQERLEWRQVVPLGAAIARGLAAAHEEGLVHQDIKPANILLGHDSSIKITDFGISQLLTAASADENVVCGTPGYIAPESLEGMGYSAKGDLFSLGVVLHECLTGRHPFAEKTLRKTILNTLNRIPEDVSPLHPDMPPELRYVIFELLDKNPDGRPDDAASVAKTLEDLMIELELEWQFTIQEPPKKMGGEHGTRVLSIRETQVLSTKTRFTADG